MKKSFVKIISVVIAVMLAVTAMACMASAAVIEGCTCNCCKTCADAGNNGTLGGNRDIYLVLDISGSMSGTPIKALKESAKQFCATMMEDETGINRIAIVTYGTHVETYNFSADYEDLAEIIDGLTAKGSTAMYDALMAVKDINEKVGNEEATKHVVVMADGLPNEGATLSSGKYTSKDSTMYYKHGNAVFSTAAGMWYDYEIYSIGFFHNLGGSQLKFGTLLMNDIHNTIYQEVFDPDKLLDAFTGVADCIIDKCICDEDCDCGVKFNCCEECTGKKPGCACGNPNCFAECTGDCECMKDDGVCDCTDICYGDCKNDSCEQEDCDTDGCLEPTTAKKCPVCGNENCTCKKIPQTGDSMVGVAAAAVVMLAGIAFVAAKKRED